MLTLCTKIRPSCQITSPMLQSTNRWNFSPAARALTRAKIKTFIIRFILQILLPRINEGAPEPPLKAKRWIKEIQHGRSDQAKLELWGISIIILPIYIPSMLLRQWAMVKIIRLLRVMNNKSTRHFRTIRRIIRPYSLGYCRLRVRPKDCLKAIINFSIRYKRPAQGLRARKRERRSSKR